MNNNSQEDINDAQEIKRQKQEQKHINESMAKWEFGKGLKKDKDSNKNVRN